MPARTQSYDGQACFDRKQWTAKVDKIKQRGSAALASVDASACQVS